MSYCVRWRRRWASSSLPSDSSCGGALRELLADQLGGALGRAVGHVVVRRRPDRDVLEVRGDQLAGERVELRERLDLVAEEHRAVGGLGVGREDLERLPLDAEVAARDGRVVAGVLDRDELAQERVAVDVVAAAQQLHVALVDVGRAQAVDAGHRRDDDHVAAREHRCGGGVAQAVDLRVDRGVLLDVEVARGDVGLGLVVVVVGDEVLDRVVGEVGPELVAELRRERLVVRDDERGPLDRLDRAGHRHRLAGAGRAQQRREAVAGGRAPRAICSIARGWSAVGVKMGSRRNGGTDPSIANRSVRPPGGPANRRERRRFAAAGPSARAANERAPGGAGAGRGAPSTRPDGRLRARIRCGRPPARARRAARRPASARTGSRRR